jgi:hypothetical protein
MYELNVQIWPEDGVFFYSVVQEFRTDNSERVEPIAYGQADTQAEAAEYVSRELIDFFS